MTRSDDRWTVAGDSYELGLGVGRPRWRSVAAVAAAVVMLVAALALVVPLGQAIDVLTGRRPVGLEDFALTPGTWLAGTVGIALLIPGARVVQARLLGVPGRYLSSVEGRFRLAPAVRSAMVVVPAFLLLTIALPGAWPQAPAHARFLPLGIAALLLTPLQAAGEEWIFRGLAGRALAALVRRRTAALAVSLVGSTALFWIGHGASEPFSIVYYLAAGTGLWLTAEWTGGLEAGCVMHASSNVLLVVPAMATGGLGSAMALHGPILLAPAAVWVIMPFVLRSTTRPAGSSRGEGR